jgi:hypothetical protein
MHDYTVCIRFQHSYAKLSVEPHFAIHSNESIAGLIDKYKDTPSWTSGPPPANLEVIDALITQLPFSIGRLVDPDGHMHGATQADAATQSQAPTSPDIVKTASTVATGSQLNVDSTKVWHVRVLLDGITTLDVPSTSCV